MMASGNTYKMSIRQTFIDSKCVLKQTLVLFFIATSMAGLMPSQTPARLLKPYYVRDANGRNIRHIPCQHPDLGQSGVCMFAWDCMKANGTHLGTCIDRFYFGSCCDLGHSNGNQAFPPVPPTSDFGDISQTKIPDVPQHKQPSFTVTPIHLSTTSKLPQPANNPSDQSTSSAPQFPIFIPNRPTLPSSLPGSLPSQTPPPSNNSSGSAVTGTSDGQGSNIPSPPQLGQPTAPSFPPGGNSGLPPPPQPQVPAVDQIPGSSNPNVVPGQTNLPASGSTPTPVGASDDIGSGSSSGGSGQQNLPNYPVLPSIQATSAPILPVSGGGGSQAMPQFPNVPSGGQGQPTPSFPGGQAPQFPGVPTSPGGSSPGVVPQLPSTGSVQPNSTAGQSPSTPGASNAGIGQIPSTPGASNVGTGQQTVPQISFPPMVTPMPSAKPNTESPANDPASQSPTQEILPNLGSTIQPVTTGPSLQSSPPPASTTQPAQLPQIVISTLPPPSTLPPLNISSPAPISTLPPPTFATLPPLNLTTLRPPTVMTVPPPNFTTRPPQPVPTFTTLPPLNISTLPPPSFMTLPPLNISTLPPLRPLNISTLPPPTIMTLPPLNISTLPPPTVITIPPPNTNTSKPPAVSTMPPIESGTESPGSPSVSTSLPVTLPTSISSVQPSTNDPAITIKPSIVEEMDDSQLGIAVADTPSPTAAPPVPTVSINPTNVVPGIGTVSSSLSSGSSSVPTAVPTAVTEMSSSLPVSVNQTSTVATLTTLSTLLPKPSSLVDKNQTSLTTLFPTSVSSNIPLATTGIPNPPAGFPNVPTVLPSKPPSIPGIDVGVASSTPAISTSQTTQSESFSSSVNRTSVTTLVQPSSQAAVQATQTVENFATPNPTQGAAAEPVTQSQTMLLPSTVESGFSSQTTSGSTLVSTVNVAGSVASSTVSQMISTGASQASLTVTSVAPTLSSSVSNIIPGIQGVLPTLTQAAQSPQAAVTGAQSSLQQQQTLIPSIQSQSSLLSTIGSQSTSANVATSIVNKPISDQTSVITQLPSIIDASQTVIGSQSTLITSVQSQSSVQSSLGSQSTITTAISEIVSSVSTSVTPTGLSTSKPTEVSVGQTSVPILESVTMTMSTPDTPSATLEPSSETTVQPTVTLEPSTDTASLLPEMSTSSPTDGLPDSTIAANDDSISRPPSGSGIFGPIPGIVGVLTSTVAQASTVSSTISSVQTHSTVFAVVTTSPSAFQNISSTAAISGQIVASQLQSQSSLSSHTDVISSASVVTSATQVFPSPSSSTSMGVSVATQTPPPALPSQVSTTTGAPLPANHSTTDDVDDFGVKKPISFEPTMVEPATTEISDIFTSLNETLVSTGLPEESFFTENGTLLITDYNKICGRRFFPTSRIVGGKEATYGKWPWQISLRQWRTSTYLHKCGAALLNENWAITAAHCVEKVPPTDLLLRIGEFDLSEEKEPYGYVERRVQIVATHPQFDARTFEYDLALLRFYEPVIFQPNIVPICVPDKDADYIGKTAFVTGWGRLYEDGPLPSRLQEVPVPIITNEACESMYRAAGYIEHIPNIFICAGWRNGGKDSCEGDSGGPMVLQRDEDNKWVLGGVISWGIGCAEPNQPGVYTRISEFRHWVNQILQF